MRPSTCECLSQCSSDVYMHYYAVHCNVVHVLVLVQKTLYSHARHTCSVAGVMVSIVAFQAVDPGSIPGRRSFFPQIL